MKLGVMVWAIMVCCGFVPIPYMVQDSTGMSIKIDTYGSEMLTFYEESRKK